MESGSTQGGGGGMTGTAQKAANNLVEAAQEVANEAVDLGEEALATVLRSVLTANKLIGEALESAVEQLVGKTGK